MQTMPTPAADPIADRIRPLGTVTLFEMMEQLNKPNLSRDEITVSLRIEWELDARIDWSEFTAEMIDEIPVDDTTALIEFYRKHVPGAPSAEQCPARVPAVIPSDAVRPVGSRFTAEGPTGYVVRAPYGDGSTVYATRAAAMRAAVAEEAAR